MTLGASRVLLAGLGALGLPFAELAAQQGAVLFLVDPDRVEEKNVATNQLYGWDQVGRAKVHATGDLLARQKPDAAGRALFADVRALGVGFLLRQQIGLVVCAADNRAAELHCARLAQLAGASFVRLAAQPEHRVVDITYLPAPAAPEGPCAICTWTRHDFRLAERRRSCSVDPVRPEASSVLLEQGRLAASLAMAILRDTIQAAPGSTLHFGFGGVKHTPVVQTSAFTRNPHCPLPHARPEWEALPDDIAVGRLVARARSRLGTTDLLVESDVPLCMGRVCTTCGAGLGPGFMVCGGQLTCSCGGAIAQDVMPPRRIFDARSFEPFADVELRALTPPVGLGLVFSAGTVRMGFHVVDAEGHAPGTGAWS